ncbi:phosphotransferase [Flavobacteriaceae bacterium]|nr:phosphotransferase [Flavobacteriaceae bacterium]
MAHYSILNKADILEILKPYSIFNIKKFQILDGGSENTNYKIDSEVGKIVLTISEQKTIKEAQDLAELLDHLKKNNFNTSELVHTSQNKNLTIYKDKPVMIKRYLEGKIMSDIPLHLLKQIGADSATLHKINPPDFLREIMWCGIERFNEVEQYALNSSFDLWLKSTANYINKHLTADLPKAFIHSDIFASNVIINDINTKATIMDFEEASYNYRLFDIAILTISLCSKNGSIDFSRVSLILKGYTSVTKLTDEEKQALQPLIVYAAAGVALWRHKNFNYIAPDNNLKDSYLNMKNLADNVRDMPSTYFKLLHEF